MIPLGDDNTRRKNSPHFTYLLIVLNILFFILELAGGESFIKQWAFIPARFLATPVSESITLFTAMFMHAGFGHLIGNMLYLWIFGDNVEDVFGRTFFIIFYVFCGLAATLAQLVFNPESNLPNLGASGAIAGVLGAYVVLFPKTKVTAMVGHIVTQIPALVVIGFWFFLQFFGSISTVTSQDMGGVAYMAHIGGFVAGFIISLLFRFCFRLNT